jgi:hypothetical protein
MTRPDPARDRGRGRAVTLARRDRSDGRDGGLAAEREDGRADRPGLTTRGVGDLRARRASAIRR